MFFTFPLSSLYCDPDARMACVQLAQLNGRYFPCHDVYEQIQRSTLNPSRSIHQKQHTARPIGRRKSGRRTPTIRV